VIGDACAVLYALIAPSIPAAVALAIFAALSTANAAFAAFSFL